MRYQTTVLFVCITQIVETIPSCENYKQLFTLSFVFGADPFQNLRPDYVRGPTKKEVTEDFRIE